jgi:hypothetical protein
MFLIVLEGSFFCDEAFKKFSSGLTRCLTVACPNDDYMQISIVDHSLAILGQCIILALRVWHYFFMSIWQNGLFGNVL